jgi:DNA-binding SARP family transcriptional activator
MNLTPSNPQKHTKPWSIMICLLGRFRLLSGCHSALECSSERVEMLLGYLALHHQAMVPRDRLLTLLWPEREPALAGQSLNSLIYGVRKAFKDKLEGVSPIVQYNGHYQLNYEAGVSTDIVQFEHWADAGEQHARTGQARLAWACYHRAVELYEGDLCLVPDPPMLIERERLRARYLTLLMRLAGTAYKTQRYRRSLTYAQRLLYHDPWREDAHRHVMRCYVQLGERVQAFRQYQLCQELLQKEFNTEPEQDTVALFDQIRLGQQAGPTGDGERHDG